MSLDTWLKDLTPSDRPHLPAPHGVRRKKARYQKNKDNNGIRTPYKKECENSFPKPWSDQFPTLKGS